jgi:4a-hydroxytetrahydrobiopterin dehydratase
MSIETLRAQHCVPRKGKDAGLGADAITGYLDDLPGWARASDGGSIAKTFTFDDYFHTMAFVNAVASVAHREDHHPDLEVRYSKCVVQYSTHDVGGLSLNDFICAAKVEDIVTGNK